MDFVFGVLIRTLRKFSGLVSDRIKIVEGFYEALNKGDYQFVNSLYHSNASYKDELFELKGVEIHALWYSAVQPDLNLSVELKSIKEVDGRVITEWVMNYTLDIINRRISLNEKGTFIFKGDKIIEHIDEYDFWSWCTQAFGIIGKSLGWSNWLRKRVRNQARKSVLANLYAAQGTSIKNE